MSVMPQRNWLFAITLLWVALIGFVAWYNNRVAPEWFDPSQEAPHGFHDEANVQRFYAALQQVIPFDTTSRALFIRFHQPECDCERLVDNYHQLMLPLLKKQGFQTITLEPPQMQQLATLLGDELWHWIPSSPALLLLDAQHNVAYFGPYHQSGICNSENSYVEPVLYALQAKQSVHIVNTLVEGCFCHYPLPQPDPSPK